MRERTPENLTELLKRFMDGTAAEAAAEEIRAGERLLEACPAPAPAERTLTAIKIRMATAALRRRWRVRVFRGALAAAAAVVMALLIGMPTRGPSQRPGVNFATIMPTSIWESDDLAADDLQLVYFTSEIRRIEAQVRALETEETDMDSDGSPDDLERELLAIETEFWKG
jgi:hypothetical protein